MKDLKKKPRKKQGRAAKVTMRALEILSETAMSLPDFVGAFLTAGYGASVGKMERARGGGAVDLEDINIRKYREMMYRLRRDKMVSDTRSPKGEIQYTLTEEGREYLEALRKTVPRLWLIPNYPKEESEEYILVTFDIPEKEKKKRDWLRAVLKRMEFVMVHQSVWIGKVKIPKDLIRDLKEKNLLDCVEFMETRRMGTLSAE